MAENFKVGDCVQLKHGAENIKMTLNYIESYGSSYRAGCKWFDTKENKFQNEIIYLDALKLCNEETKEK